MIGRHKRLAAACALVAGLAPTVAVAVEIKPSARLHLDYAGHREDARPLRDGLAVRRASVGLEIGFAHNWKFEVDYDLAGVYALDSRGSHRHGEFSDGFRDVAFHYSGWDGATLTLGQTKLPFGLEALTSSNNTRFIERSLVDDALAPSRRLGVGVALEGKAHTLAATAFGNSLDGDARGNGVALRGTLAPLQDGTHILHLGAALLREWPNEAVRFSARPESRISDVRLLNTGRLRDVQRIDLQGIEMAWQSGRFALQGEWQQARLTRSGQGDARLHGGYVEAGWMLKGGSRRYRKGVFKGVPVEAGGAWELAARVSRVDLDDAGIRGGSERNHSLGLTYYASPRLRIMANYIDVHSQRRDLQDNPDILLLRLQLVL